MNNYRNCHDYDYRDECRRPIFENDYCTQRESYSCCESHDNDDYDFGPNPVVLDLDNITMSNKTFRTSIWTGESMQAVVMCVEPCAFSGVMCLEDADWFIDVVSGELKIELGKYRDDLCYCKTVKAGCSIFIPAGTWVKAGNPSKTKPLKLLEFYSSAQFPRGTVDCTKEEAEARFNRGRN
ncbi:MAG: cupin domain-containing protein [Clostridia bacterium]